MASPAASAGSSAGAGRAYHALMSACGVLSALLFGAMGLLVCIDVLMRNLGGGSIPWSVEMTEYMLMAATFVAAPWLLYLGDHIRIDIVLRAVPAHTRRLLDLFSNLAGLVISALLAWQCVVVAADTAEQGAMIFKVLVFPEWWLNIPMGFACVLLGVEFARRLWLDVAGGR